MSITGYDMVTVQSDFVAADVIVWRRYRMVTNGILEAMLDANPHLAKLHKHSPFLPPGTQVRVPIDPEVMKGMPKTRKTITLFGRVK